MIERRALGDSVVRGFGQALIAVGLIALLFVGYQVWVTDEINAGRQSELTQDLREQWEAGAGPEASNGLVPDPLRDGVAQLPLGEGFAFIRIPRFGPDYVRVILEGTDEDKLTEGPGHYPASVLPGEVGNFALAGHRIGQGAPFEHLDQLEPNDAIIIETRDTWFVYRMLGDASTGADPDAIPGRRIVDPSAVEVVDPVPGQPAATPTRSLLTLTTCHPRFSNAQRLIIHAELAAGPLSKGDHPDGPPALSEG